VAGRTVRSIGERRATCCGAMIDWPGAKAGLPCGPTAFPVVGATHRWGVGCMGILWDDAVRTAFGPAACGAFCVAAIRRSAAAFRLVGEALANGIAGKRISLPWKSGAFRPVEACAAEAADCRVCVGCWPASGERANGCQPSAARGSETRQAASGKLTSDRRITEARRIAGSIRRSSNERSGFLHVRLSANAHR